MLQLLLNNKHTTIAGAIYIITKFGCNILGVWYPEYKAQYEATANYVEGAAVAYGLFAAGDANKSATKTDVQEVTKAVISGDTEPLVRKEIEKQIVADNKNK